VEISRWCVRRGVVPAGTDALILLTIEELAANELRQPFHHWISTIRVPVANDALQAALPHISAALDCAATEDANPNDHDAARDLWLEVEQDVAGLLLAHAESCRTAVQERLKNALQQALATEKERFRSRRSEVRRQLNERSIAKLTREVEDLRLQAQQLHFDSDRNAAIRSELHDLEAELERRTKHDNDLLRYLEHEEKRVVETMLPRQFTLRGEVQVFPVAVQIRFPGQSQSEPVQ
jgi:hypothetical protein